MAPTLFNLYASIVSERWSSRVHRMEGVGTLLLHKFDQSRATRNTQEVQLCKGEFVDDAVLLACSRQGSSLQQDRTCVCACVCVRACVCACVCARVCVCVL